VKDTYLTLDEPSPDHDPQKDHLIASGYITVKPSVTEFSWRLRNEIRDNRWSALVWLIGERFSLELSDLDNAVFRFQTDLSHGEDYGNSTPH